MKLSLNINPLNKPATWEQIEAERDALRESPIVVDSGLTFHADEDSFVLFENSIKHFNDLEELDENGKLGWKDANKTYHPYSKEELTALRDELSLKRAKRASKLQVRAEALNAIGCTVGELEDLATWGLT